MRAVDLIAKKRDGYHLSEEEWHWFIQSYVNDEIPDYQASALLMAVYLRGMSERETTALTEAIVQSGEVLDLSEFGRVVDKHSSGGVGDKTTLVVGPIVAAAGLPVAKMSGRGLGFTGGTLDKLESIPGWRSDLSRQQFLDQVRRIGVVVAGATAKIAPGDQKLYALRDVTGTVSSLPLIASSIMSKKLAAGADAIVLDVKVGEGAFMTTLDDARELAEAMVDIGRRTGRAVTALLSDMNQPLGRAVGNALEVHEAIDTLHGRGPDDFAEHCQVVAAHMLLLGHKVSTLAEGEALAQAQVTSGAAWQKFHAMITAQGGEAEYIEHPQKLPQAPVQEEVRAPQSARLAAINAREVGLTVVELGGGRKKKSDPIDPAVGVMFHAKVGDLLEADQPLLTIHAATPESAEHARQRLLHALHWHDAEATQHPLFHDVISTENL